MLASKKKDKPVPLEEIGESPVLLDSYAPSDYLKFTDFHPESLEYNFFDNRVFLQSKYWVNIEREFILIDNMSRGYLINVRNMVERKSDDAREFLIEELFETKNKYADNAFFGYHIQKQIDELVSYPSTKKWFKNTELVLAIDFKLLQYKQDRLRSVERNSSTKET